MQAQGFTFHFSIFYNFQDGDSHFPHRLDSIIKINFFFNIYYNYILILYYILKEGFVETN